MTEWLIKYKLELIRVWLKNIINDLWIKILNKFKIHLGFKLKFSRKNWNNYINAEKIVFKNLNHYWNYGLKSTLDLHFSKQALVFSLFSYFIECTAISGMSCFAIYTECLPLKKNKEIGDKENFRDEMQS